MPMRPLVKTQPQFGNGLMVSAKITCDHQQNALEQIPDGIALYGLAHRFTHGRSSGVERNGHVLPLVRFPPQVYAKGVFSTIPQWWTLPGQSARLCLRPR